MLKKIAGITLLIILGSLLFFNLSLAQFNGTHTFALFVENEKQGHLTLTFNPDGTIVGQADMVNEEVPLPLVGMWGKKIFVIKYTLSDKTEILDHCRFTSEIEFIGFERYKRKGVRTQGIAKIFGSKRSNI